MVNFSSEHDQHTMDRFARIHLFEALVYLFKALIHLFEALIY